MFLIFPALGGVIIIVIKFFIISKININLYYKILFIYIYNMSFNLKNLNITCSPMYNSQNTKQFLGYMCDNNKKLKERFQNSSSELSSEVSIVSSMTPSMVPNMEFSMLPSMAPSMAPNMEFNMTPSMAPNMEFNMAPSMAPSMESNMTPAMVLSIAPSSVNNNSSLYFKCPEGWTQENEDDDNGTCSFNIFKKTETFQFGPKYGGFPLNRKTAVQRHNDIVKGSEDVSIWNIRSQDLKSFDSNSVINVPFDKLYKCPPFWKQKNEDTNNGSCNFTINLPNLPVKSDSFNFGPKYGGFPVNRKTATQRYSELDSEIDETNPWDNRVSTWDKSMN